MTTTEDRYETRLGTGLILLGVCLLGAVALWAFSIIGDPGGNYDSWVPDDEVTGPEASFDWTSSGRTVDFTDTSQAGAAPIQRWLWDFGDGTVSEEPNPTHQFSEDGEWQVTLDVVAGSGSSSQAEGMVEIEPAAINTGDGAIGLNDMADKVVQTVERAAKGSLVVVLVIGMFLVLVLVGGRMVSNGVRMLRPGPKRINMKLRPKELELAMTQPTPEIESAEKIRPLDLTSVKDEPTDVLEPA